MNIPAFIQRLHPSLWLFIYLFNSACSSSPGSEQSAKRDDWQRVDSILQHIQAPVFPDKDFVITDFGAKGDGQMDCTEAIKKAMNACVQDGGGRVVIPKGKFMTGPVYLQSNVNLHLEEGATLAFSTNPQDYLPLVYTRWEGVELMNYSPLIYAYEEENIAITGKGTLDGQANESNWWPWKGRADYGYREGMPEQGDEGNRPALFAMAEDGVPVADRKFGEGHYLRPQFVQPYRCQNVLIQGITVTNSPMWLLNPVLCENVTIDGVKLNSRGPNSDGCDPESCHNVLIKNCTFNTGDDCIAIKSGRNADGRRIHTPSENIIIRNCQMADGHGGVVIGSEISGGVRNVFAENCVMNSPYLDRALRIKTSSMRGGVVENIYLRNITVGQVAEETIRVNMFYEDSGSFIPVVRNIQIKDMKVQHGGKTAIRVEAYPDSPLDGLMLQNLKIDDVVEKLQVDHVKNVSVQEVYVNGDQIHSEDF